MALGERISELLAGALSADEAGRDANWEAVAEELRKAMEALAGELKDLVLATPETALLGYLWTQAAMCSIAVAEGRKTDDDVQSQRDVLFFAMEYVHAILSCHAAEAGDAPPFDDTKANRLLEVAFELREAALQYATFSSIPRKEAAFGEDSGRVEFYAKTNWAAIRGHRYPVLESEFLEFVLRPHDEAMRRAYGANSAEVAAGIQAVVTAMRTGISDATEKIRSEAESTYALAAKEGLPLEDAIARTHGGDDAQRKQVRDAYDDIFHGGICNLSKQTRLPEALLSDLAFERGENKEFFADGPFSGTPMRTLPARVRPLIRLAHGYYAVDPFFIRDSAYRAIQRGLLQRLPDYREEWKRRQARLVESAFATILSQQVAGALVLREVFYRDPQSDQWVEVDTLILHDDVLIQIEAKAGVGAMDSPATNFESHVRAVQRLVLDAYAQCKRFFEYAASKPVVSLFRRVDGTYVEVHQLRLSKYRLALPIGMNVENFSPFSTMCKELSTVEPILGRHPFLSMSVDDLFVLNRFLPTAGELFHYLEVRQQVAGLRRAMLFDEMDHLGAYITHNRIDVTIREQLAAGTDALWMDRFSDIVDNFFEAENWRTMAPPAQPFPAEFLEVFALLNVVPKTGILRAHSLIRNQSEGARNEMAQRLREMAPSVLQHGFRYFTLSGEAVLLVWMQRDVLEGLTYAMRLKAQAVALASNVPQVDVLWLSGYSAEGFTVGGSVAVLGPTLLDPDYAAIVKDADGLRERMQSHSLPIGQPGKRRRPNEPCWCGSGRKFKKCHGRLAQR